MQTSSGLAVDLAAPRLEALHVEFDIAGPLSRLARFAGHRCAPDGPVNEPAYSVAQHCVVGADAILAETGDVTLALAFLVHDAHEALIGGLTTPAALALEHWAEAAMRIAGGREFADAVRSALGCGVVRAGLDGMKAALDAEIHARAELPHPLPTRLIAAVKDMDIRMLDLERRLILGVRVRGTTARDLWGAVVDAAPVRLRGALTPWSAKRARDEWMKRWALWTAGRVTPADAPREPSTPAPRPSRRVPPAAHHRAA